MMLLLDFHNTSSNVGLKWAYPLKMTKGKGEAVEKDGNPKKQGREI